MSRDLASGYQSAGYNVLYSAVTMARTFTPFMAQFGIMVDAVVSQNNLSTSATSHTGLKVNVTQDMIDQMKAAVPANLLAGFDAPPLGQNDMPDFVYDVSTNSNFAYSMTITLPGGTGTESVYWNQDKSKFGMSVSMSGTTFTVANDDATQSTVMNIGASGMSYLVKFRADPAAKALHGVFVTLDNSFTMGETTLTSTVLGYGDDNGGSVTFDTNGMLYKEIFSALGAVTYQAFTLNEVTTELLGSPSTTYDAKLTNTDWGDAPTFF